MMPIGVPRVPYRTPGENSWQWVDLWNCLYRERIIFIGQGINEELGNQVRARPSCPSDDLGGALLHLDSSAAGSSRHAPVWPSAVAGCRLELRSRGPPCVSPLCVSVMLTTFSCHFHLPICAPQLVGTMLFLDSLNQKDMFLYINSMVRRATSPFVCAIRRLAGPPWIARRLSLAQRHRLCLVQGGEVVPTLTIHDTIKHVRSDVGTVAFGGAMAMAGFLLAIGTKASKPQRDKEALPRACAPCLRVAAAAPRAARRADTKRPTSSAGEALLPAEHSDHAPPALWRRPWPGAQPAAPLPPPPARSCASCSSSPGPLAPAPALISPTYDAQSPPTAG